MKRTIRLRESELRNVIAESVKRVLRENNTESIEIYTNVSKNDGNNGDVYPTDLWFRNGSIIVRWAGDNGADITSDLLTEDPSMIWEILKGIKN